MAKKKKGKKVVPKPKEKKESKADGDPLVAIPLSLAQDLTTIITKNPSPSVSVEMVVNALGRLQMAVATSIGPEASVALAKKLAEKKGEP